jgi:hypothetical protein
VKEFLLPSITSREQMEEERQCGLSFKLHGITIV